MARRELLFKSPTKAVGDTLAGMKAAYPGLYIDPENRIVMLNRNRNNRVGLICGCGSGIEPFGVGVVGEGMLTAFVYGNLFQAPTVKAISKAIHNVAMLNQGGVLVLLLNYPKQVLNFGLAIEKARLKGILVESFVITDDCSRTEVQDLVALETNLALRIGLVGSVYGFKILGAMSTLGYSLKDILDQAMILNFRLATIGFALSGCNLNISGDEPVLSKCHLKEGEVTVGFTPMTDYAGVRNIKADSIRSVIRELIPNAVVRCGLEENTCCCVLVNNLGAMSSLELYAMTNEIDLLLGELNICVDRIYVGSVMTSLETHGVLIGLLNSTGLPQWLTFLDTCTEAFAWPGCRLSKVNKKIELKEYKDDELLPITSQEGMILSYSEVGVFRRCLKAACEEIIKAEDIINRLNSVTGNGDCGTNMKGFATHLLEKLKEMPLDDVSKVFSMCSSIADEKMTGSIGSLYSLAFDGAAQNTESWVDCWNGAIQKIKKITGTKVGDRSLIDVLEPAFCMFAHKIQSLGEESVAYSWEDALKAAVNVAECWCFKTASAKPKVGRARFMNKGKKMNMDAGAYGVYVWLKAVQKALMNKTIHTTSEDVDSPSKSV